MGKIIYATAAIACLYEAYTGVDVKLNLLLSLNFILAIEIQNIKQNLEKDS